MAEETSTGPIQVGDRGNHVLEREGDSRLVFRPKLWVRFLGWGMFGFGVAMLALLVPVFALTGEGIEAYGMLVFFAPFIGIGHYIARRLGYPIVFDREAGMFEKRAGATAAPPVPHRNGAEKRYDRTVEERGSLSLEAIHALQLLYIVSRHQRPRYELNLVRADGSRVHVLAKTELEREAEELASFLDVPLWRS